MKFYIFPGLGETKKDYLWLIEAAEKKYSVVFIDLDFNKNSFSELKKIKLEPDSIVFGFSIGALVAYKNISPVSKGIYCSISNILGEDTLGKEKDIKDIFNEKMLDEFKNENYGKPNTKDYIIFCGENELDKTTRKFENLEIIKNTEHILNTKYRRRIINNI